MEDYKKKYEETIEKLNKFYLTHLGNRDLTIGLAESFPELKECSEERTKIELIGFIKSRLAGFPDCKRFTEWIEKHSGEKEPEKTKQNDDSKNKPLKGEDYGIDGLYCALDILKKTLGNVDGYQTDDGILEHKVAIDTIKDLYISRNTKWTKEDDDMYDRCLMALANWRDSVERMGRDTKTCQEIIDWLRAKIQG